MSEKPYKRPPLVRWINAGAYLVIAMGLFAGWFNVLGIEKLGPNGVGAALMMMAWGALTLLVVRIVDCAGRSAHASEEASERVRVGAELLRQAAKNAEAKEDLLRQPLQFCNDEEISVDELRRLMLGSRQEPEA